MRRYRKNGLCVSNVSDVKTLFSTTFFKANMLQLGCSNIGRSASRIVTNLPTKIIGAVGASNVVVIRWIVALGKRDEKDGR